MEEKEKNDFRKEDIFAKAVRAGKRTYFFDVRATRANEYFLTITESKRRFNNEQGKFYYEKHKVFLYKEDFEKFKEALTETLDFIEENQPEKEETEDKTTSLDTDINFEDLSSDDETKSEESSEQESDTE
ncbi:MAG: PUR family DNA/RNA-binding protein [Bacteroidales bacterium]|nr:PUR family DNA/RNA-binding protein [Bacteroidales bacterium]